MSMTDARRKVRTTIENTINALQGGDNKVNPLGNQILNKLADVTLTKCEQPPTGQLISECPFDILKEYFPNLLKTALFCQIFGF